MIYDFEYNFIINRELVDEESWGTYEKYFKHDNVDYTEPPSESRWPDVLLYCDAFKSKSDARKNGWNKDIDAGFSWAVIGKHPKRSVVIYKMTPQLRKTLDDFNEYMKDRCDICERLGIPGEGVMCGDCEEKHNLLEEKRKSLTSQKFEVR